MQKVKVEEAIGKPICHDMTKIVKDKFKKVAFKKGHIIRKEDILELKKMGKEHIYIYDNVKGLIHEDKCAVRIGMSICDDKKFDFSSIKEGKINVISKYAGIFKVNRNMLYSLNTIQDISISTIYDNVPVLRGQKLASARIIPMFTDERNIEAVENICKKDKLFTVNRFYKKNISLIITGNEIYNGLIKDEFYNTLKPKIEYYGSSIINSVKLPDDNKLIENEIERSIKNGSDMVICTGGMSVDEDDVTPLAISNVCSRIITHGVPVQPGNMFMLAYKNDIPVIGIPTAAIFDKITIFDVVFPLIIAGEKLNREFFVKLSLGGLCMKCNECHYPNCTYCKGR